MHGRCTKTTLLIYWSNWKKKLHIQGNKWERIAHQHVTGENESNISPTANAMGDSTSLTCHQDCAAAKRWTAASRRSRQNLMQTVLCAGVWCEGLDELLQALRKCESCDRILMRRSHWSRERGWIKIGLVYGGWLTHHLTSANTMRWIDHHLKPRYIFQKRSGTEMQAYH